MSIVTVQSISHNDFFTFWKISTGNLRILWHQATDGTTKRLVRCKVCLTEGGDFAQIDLS